MRGTNGLTPSEIQRRLMQVYGLDEALPDVAAFVCFDAACERERVVLRQSSDGALELRIELPLATLRAVASLDGICQLIEGVSHFLLLAERARCELPTSQLELELQAEVDKYVLLVVARERPLSPAATAALRRLLFDRAEYVDPPGTELGDRYRMASRLAERFTHQLEHRFLAPRRTRELAEALRRFYRAGPSAKITLARAA